MRIAYIDENSIVRGTRAEPDGYTPKAHEIEIHRDLPIMAHSAIWDAEKGVFFIIAEPMSPHPVLP
jgi:hypothetical protein